MKKHKADGRDRPPAFCLFLAWPQATVPLNPADGCCAGPNSIDPGREICDDEIPPMLKISGCKGGVFVDRLY